jgi:hypothetical protein
VTVSGEGVRGRGPHLALEREPLVAVVEGGELGDVPAVLDQQAVVVRRAVALGRLHWELVPDVQDLLDALDDEDEGDEAGEALLGEAGDVADVGAVVQGHTDEEKEAHPAPDAQA